MLTERRQILLVDDEPNLRKVLSVQLRREGYDVLPAEDGEQALSLLRENHIDVVLTDLRMPKLDGMGLLTEVGKHFTGLPVIMMTAHGTVDTAVSALKLGAFDYLTKPFDKDEVRIVLAKALRTASLEASHATFGTTRGKFGIVGESKELHEVYTLIEKVADTPTTVLIRGESGTGKELAARALHEQSRRADKAFIKVNCAAIPTDLIESELFGYERGAFTGAVASKPGRFELAHGGTLFLDEIGEVSAEMQVKLLRALQEGEFERVGGVRTTRVDVRVVAATNRDLAKDMAAGTFRRDLYYRLNVVSLRMPALAERTADIPLLVEHFLTKFNAKLSKRVESCGPEAMAALMSYAWPGNVRELENVMERAVLFCDGSELLMQDLPEELTGVSSASGDESDLGFGDALAQSGEGGLKEHVRMAMAKLERELVKRALEQSGGNVTHTARLLKISRKGLQLKMKELGLRENDGEG